MFERFTDRVHRVVVLTQDEAHGLRHNCIGTEHPLLGLISEGKGVAAKVLKTMEIKGEVVRTSVTEITGEGERPAEGHIPSTLRTKRVLELSLHEALQLGHNYIGMEYLLLGLLEEGEGVTTQILVKRDVDLAQVRQTVTQMPSGYQRGDDGSREPVGAGVDGSSGPERSDSAILEQFGRNLTQITRENKLDPVVGRRIKMECVMQVLSRRTENNLVLIGKPGVDKTAVIGGLAQAVVHDNVPKTIRDRQIHSLDMGPLVVGLCYRGDFEERLKEVLKEIRTRGNIIPLIGGIHTLVGADAAEGSIDAVQMLKPMLACGEFQTIGATTNDEYRKYIEKDTALERRFQPVKVEEPGTNEAVEILKGLCDRYKAHHWAIITDVMTQAAAELAGCHISSRFPPDKTIDLVDEAGAQLRIRRITAPPELREIDEKIAEVRRSKEAAIDSQDFERAASPRNEESKLNGEREAKGETWKGSESDEIAEIGDQGIAKVLTMSTGIPVVRLTQIETAKLLKMEDELYKHVIGQDETVKAPTQSIRRTCSGLRDPNHPGGSFIFAGPIGVGKTELAKALAEFLFGDEDALIQLDIPEFSEKHTASRLFGVPPGYVGYDEGGQLTGKIRHKSFLIALFDEVERAHPGIFNSLFQILEGGHLTDSQGRKVDFKNIVIIMTTNLGTRDINKGVLTGFQTAGDSTHDYGRIKSKVVEELKQHLRPEFLNHVDDTIVFPPLTKPEISRIVDLMIAKLAKRMEVQDMHLQLTDDTCELPADMGFSPVLDARPLYRVIQREIENILSKRIFFGELQSGQVVIVGVTGEGKDRAFTFNGKRFTRQLFEVDKTPFLEGGPSFCGEPPSSC